MLLYTQVIHNLDNRVNSLLISCVSQNRIGAFIGEYTKKMEYRRIVEVRGFFVDCQVFVICFCVKIRDFLRVFTWKKKGDSVVREYA